MGQLHLLPNALAERYLAPGVPKPSHQGQATAGFSKKAGVVLWKNSRGNGCFKDSHEDYAR